MDFDISISKMTVAQMTKTLSAAYSKLINDKKPLKRFPSVMLWGAPGVGKSQGVRQIAEKIEKQTKKRVFVTDVRLLLFNPVDLRGIPTANAEKTLAIWLKPQIFQMDNSEDVINILFLDEISAAPPSVQAAAYQITLDRKVGEHMLPDNCIVMAAGNRSTDKSVAFTMPRALANRLLHIEINGDTKSWHNWAITAGIHDIVTGFIEYNPSRLMRNIPEDKSLAFPTPRSWEMVSNIFTDISDDINQVYPLLVGCIGNATASELKNWCEIYSRLPNVEKICNGETEGIPTRPEALYALASKIIKFISENPDKTYVNNVVEYSRGLPNEFKSRIYNDLLQIPQIIDFLRENEYFVSWYKESKRMINA